MTRLAVCRKCGRYSLRAACPVCAAPTVSPHPVRYSPEDRFGEYRRRLKRLSAAESSGKGGGA